MILMVILFCVIKSIVLPFEDEKFIPDNIPFVNSNRFGQYKLINDVIYIGDYLEDGMSSNVRKFAMNNIKGYIFEKKILQKQPLSIKYRIVNNVKYIYYSVLAKKNFINIYKYSDDKFFTVVLYLPVCLLLRRRMKEMLGLLDFKVLFTKLSIRL